MSGRPLPELVEFRLTAKKKVILFIREGEAFYRKHLDLTKEGAGLWAINPAFGNACFRRSDKTVSYDKVGEAAYMRFIAQNSIVVSVSPAMATGLARVLWGQELDFTAQIEMEGVQPVQPHLNAAD
ncbi:hypothetical protein HLB42_09580 [Deinococcus sp. D7000]|nr:hypothetical protein HLB42_09580 [Deinococcus sp. D7000]